MLSWLEKFFVHSAPPPQAQQCTLVRVEQNEKSITVHDPGGHSASTNWSSIERVAILTTDAGPFATDLFWSIESTETPALIVPMGAEGEHDLLKAMQRRLEAFDNMMVVEAMGAAEKARFLVWEADE